MLQALMLILLSLLMTAPNSLASNSHTDNVSSYGFPVDKQTCKASHLLQVQRALHDVEVLTDLALDTLLNKPHSEIVHRYFGSAPNEVDVTVPIGVLTRIKDTKKDGGDLEIRCEAASSLACKHSERIVEEGGFVARTANVTSAIGICPSDFSDSKASPRKFLEEICQDDWTLSDDTPTSYWPAAMLSLLLQTPQLSSPSMALTARAYGNVLELAQRSPRQAEHNTYTYLYFMLDLFARAHVHGGCSGQTPGRVHERTWQS